MVWSATTGALASWSTRCSTAPRPSPTWRGRSSTLTPTSCGTPRSRLTFPRTHRSTSSLWCKVCSSRPGAGLATNSLCATSSSPPWTGPTFRTQPHHMFLRFKTWFLNDSRNCYDDLAMLILKGHNGVPDAFNHLNSSDFIFLQSLRPIEEACV